MSAKQGGGGQGKSVKKRQDRNLLSAKYFRKMLYHQTVTEQTKINELKTIRCYKHELMRPSKGIINFANLKVMFIWLFFEEIELTANAKSLMQVFPCTAAMQKFHASYMNISVLCHFFDMSSQHISNRSKYFNEIADYNKNLAIHEVLYFP